MATRKISLAVGASLLILLLAMAVSSPTSAAVVITTWQGGATGNWNDGGNWTNGVPNNGGGNVYDVLIDGADTATDVVVSLDMTAFINNLSIDAGDALSFQNGRDLGITGSTITNAGEISMNSTGSATLMYISNTVTLSGGGTLSLSANLSNQISDDGGANGRLINLDNIIQGGGNIGGDTLAVTNRGLIDANTDVLLRLDPRAGADGFINSGTLRGSTPAGLRLNPGTFTNYEGETQGTIVAADGGNVWIEGAHIVGGVLDSIGTGAIETISYGFLEDLTNQGTYRVNNGDNTYLYGTIHNTGTIEMLSGGSRTYLFIQSTATLTGGGTVSLSANSQNWFFDDGGADGRLINQDNTIQGAGNIGGDTLAVTNRGLIDGNSTVELLLDPRSGADGFINSGVMRGSTEAGLRLGPGTFTNHEGETDGTILAADGGNVWMASGHVVGGVLDTEGTGLIQTNSAGRLQDLTNQGTYRINNSDDTWLYGTITNTGTIVLNSGGSRTNLYIPGEVTLDGGGTISMSANSQNWFYDDGGADGRLINQDNTIEGAGNVGGDVLAVTNRGLIDGNSTIALTLDPRATADAFINSGVLRGSSAAGLRLNGGTFTNYEGETQGTILAVDGGSVWLSGGSVVGGVLDTEGTGLIQTNSLGYLSDLTNLGTYRVNNSDNTYLYGTITNTGTIELTSAGSSTHLYVPGTVTLAGDGTVALSDNAFNIIQDDGAGDGVLINQGNTIQGSGKVGANTMRVVNRGVILGNQANALTVDPVNTADGVINSGFLRASDGGMLVLHDGTFQNFEDDGGIVPGVVEALDGSIVRLQGGAMVYGGLVRTEGSGAIDTANFAALRDVTLEGLYRVNNGHSTTLVGTNTNLPGSTLLVNSVGASTYLYIDDPAGVTLTGGGTVTLSDQATNYISDPGSGDGILINDNHTIEGAGSLGNNTLAIVNRGRIGGNAENHSLVVDPRDVADGVVNSGVMLGSTAAGLVLGGGYFTNHEGATPGTILATDGGNVWLAGARVSGGILQTEGTGRIITSSWGLFEDLANEGNVLSDNGDYLYLNGAVENSGDVRIGSTGGSTYLYVPGTTTLSGGGTVSTSDFSTNRITDDGGSDGHLINLDNTIHGSGDLGGNTLAFTNRGLILADQANALVVDPRDGPADFINTGTLRADGGILRLTNGTFTNFEDETDGVIEALDASSVQLGGASIIGGVLRSFGSGVIETNSTGWLTDLRNEGTFRVNNGDWTMLDGTIDNVGAIQVNSTGGNTYLYVPGIATLTGGGTVDLSDVGLNHISDNSNGDGHLVNEDNTIRGSGGLGENTLAITNRGLILADQTNALVIDPRDAVGSFLNTGTLRADGGTLRLVNGTFTNFENETDGVIEALDASSVQLGSASIVGGVLRSFGSGVVETNSTGWLTDLRNEGTFRVNNGHWTMLYGTIDNAGTIELASTGGNTYLYIPEIVTLTGGGTVVTSDTSPNHISDNGGGDGHLVNEDNTISGSGGLGENTLQITNRGTIEASQGTPLTIDPNAAGMLNDTDGVLRGSGTGGLSLTAGSFNNLGTVEALDGSAVTYSTSAVTVNNNAGTLREGTWRAIAQGNGATVTIRGDAIHTIGVGTEVVLSGDGSVFQAATTDLAASLTTNLGTLRILDNRDYTNANDLMIGQPGLLELGGGVFDAPVLDNAGRIFGFGTITPRPTNTGTITASGGTLVMSAGIQGGSGTVKIDPGAVLDLSGATTSSSADNLFHMGNDLNLGANDFLVMVDYINTNWGIGNDFNPRANVTGSGQILATPAVAQSLVGDVADGTEATPSMDFEAIHVGDTVELHFNINNDGTTGPNLRGAIQTNNAAGFGGNLTDPRLSGTGATAQDFGPIAVGGVSADYAVAFTGLTAGPLVGQQVAVVNNFDNVANQVLTFAGTAYRYANPTDHLPEPVDFGNVREGTLLEQALSITNDVPADGYSEALNAAIGTATGDVSAWGAFNLLLPGMTDSASLMVGIDTATAGAKSGTATIGLESDGTGSSGLGITVLSSQIVNVQANVFRLAAPSAHVPEPVVLGNVHVGGTLQQTLSLTNSAAADGYSEALNAAIGTATGDVYASGAFNMLLPEQTDGSSLLVGVNTTTAGAKSGTATISLESDGTGSSGLGILPLASQTVNVSGAVYRLAAPSDHMPEPVNLGVARVGDVVEWTLDIGNTAAADGYSEALNASIGGATGDIYAAGAFNLLLPEQTDDTSLMVGINTTTAGAKTGTATISLESDGTGSSSLGVTGLSGQTVNVSAAVYRLAAPSDHMPEPVNLGVAHVGDVVEWTLDISNTAVADGYSEALNASIGGATGGIYASGAFSLLLPEQTDGTSLMVGVNTTTAGAKSGTATISLESDGAGSSGLGALALAPQTVNVSATVYRLADPTLTSTDVDLGIVHVGDLAEGYVELTNAAAADGFSEALNAAFSGTTGDAYASGTMSLLAPGNTDDTSLMVGVDTSTAGMKSGTAMLDMESDGTGSSLLGTTALGSQEISVHAVVNAYASPTLSHVAGDGLLSQTGTDSYLLDFGELLVGSPMVAADLSVFNDVLAPADDLAGSWVFYAADFDLSGFDAFADIAPGESFDGLQIAFTPTSEGIIDGLVVMSPESVNPEWSGSLGDVTLHITGQVVVPEPATLVTLLAGLGFAAAWAFRRRRGSRK